jgi:hypothetical protein
VKRPSASDFRLGSPLAVKLSFASAALTTLAWRADAVSWLVPVCAFILCSKTLGARKRVAIWRQWRSSWDETAQGGQYAGQAPARPKPEREQAQPAPTPEAQLPASASRTDAPQARRRIPRSALIITWVVLFAWIKAHEGDAPDTLHGIVGLGFLALTLWGTASLGWRALHWLLSWVNAPAGARAGDGATPASEQRADTADPDGNPIVTQCLPVRRMTPPGHVRELLPAYCRALLAPGKVASDESEQAASSAN